MIYLVLALTMAMLLEAHNMAPGSLRGFGWLESYRDAIIGLFRDSDSWNGPAGLLAVIVLPVFVISIIQFVFAPVSFGYGVFATLFGALILMFCLRFQEMDKGLEVLTGIDSHQHPEQLAMAERQASLELLEGKSFEVGERYRKIAEAALVQANDRLFAVVFWFMVLGPAGAILYRMSVHLAEHSYKRDETNAGGFNDAAIRLHGILAWVPARLTAFGYALAGGFEDAIHSWREMSARESEDEFSGGTERVLCAAGTGALHIDRYESLETGQSGHVAVSLEALKAVRALILRTLLIWGAVCIVIALISVIR